VTRDPTTDGPEPNLLGQSSGKQMDYLTVKPTEEQKELARQSPLWDRGDMMLIWVNTGDLSEL
jgi:hypothetical protein